MREKHFTLRQPDSECPNIGTLVNFYEVWQVMPRFKEKLLFALSKHFDVEKEGISLPEIPYIFESPYYYEIIVVDISYIGSVEIEIEETWLY